MKHISAEPYDPNGPPACGVSGEVISQRLACTVLEYGATRLARITADDLCGECLEIVGRYLVEMQTQIRKESHE